MKLTKTELMKLIQEVVEESHTKADEEKLKKISKQLKKSTTMHKKQADDLDNIVNRSDDKKLGEDVSPPAGSKELYSKTSFGEESLSPEQIEDFAAEIADEVKTTDGRREKVAHKKMRKLGLSPTSEDFIRLMDRVDSILDRSGMKEGVNNGKISRSYLSTVIKEEIQTVLESFEQDFLDSGDPRDRHNDLKTLGVMARPRLSKEELFVLFGNQLIEMYDQEATTEEGVPIHFLKYDLGREGIHNMMELIENFDENPHKHKAVFDIRTDTNGKYILVANNKFERVGLYEKKKKKACKRFAKRVNGKCRSYGQAGQAKGGGDRIRPGTKKGDAYCARSAKIKKCKNPPCANDLSRKKWKCRGSKSMK